MSGATSKRVSFSAPSCSICSSRISTGPRIWWRMATFLPHFSTPTRHFSGRSWACVFPRTAICICLPSILPVRPTASGGCWPIARKRLRGAVMRWRTAPSFPMFYPISSVPRMYCASPHFSVRRRRVYLKTVDGLEKVDVILRRVDDSFCDPLELRGDSLLGVPGLVDAIVAGNVQVAHALGSGLMETAAIMPFLPGLSTQLLGEKLKLPSVATWWCGHPYALDWVLDHLDSVVVKPAFPSRAMEPVFGAALPHAEQGKV